MPFQYTRNIKFQDTDAAGVVYFANVLSICHEAYEESLAASGIDLKLFFSNSSTAIPIVHASVDFLRPIYCGDRLIIELTPKLINNHKFEIQYQARKSELVAKATTIHVCIDLINRNKQDLYDEILRWLQLNQNLE